MKPSRLFQLSALFLFAAFFLSGCVDLKADLVFSPDGSGRMSVDYRVDRAVAALEKTSGGADALPLPLEKAALDQRVRSTPGVSRNRWSREDLKDEIHILAEFGFSDPASFARFLDPNGKRVSYKTVDRVREFGIVLASGSRPPDDAAAWVDLSYEKDSVDLSVTLPDRALSVSAGTLSASGTTVRYSIPTSEILKSPNALTWTIRW